MKRAKEKPPPRHHRHTSRPSRGARQKSARSVRNKQLKRTDVIARFLRPSPGWHRAGARTPRLIIFREGNAKFLLKRTTFRFSTRNHIFIFPRRPYNTPPHHERGDHRGSRHGRYQQKGIVARREPAHKLDRFFYSLFVSELMDFGGLQSTTVGRRPPFIIKRI